MDKLPLLEDSHFSFVLLRSCFSLPKLSYMTRTSSPAPLSSQFLRFDSLLRSAFETIVGCPLTELQWLNACLPASMGGVGIRRSFDLAPASFLASVSFSLPLVEEVTKHPSRISISDPLAIFNLKCGEDFVEEAIVSYTQKQLSFLVDSRNKSTLTDSLTSPREKARVNSIGLPKAGLWLNASPCKALGLHMSNKEFQVSLKYHLGLPVFSGEGICPACGKSSDALGDHAVGCGGEGERISRHNALRDALFQAASQAALGPSKEESALIPGSNCRPADVFLRGFENGMDCALDVTVVSPCSNASWRNLPQIQGPPLLLLLKERCVSALKTASVRASISSHYRLKRLVAFTVRLLELFPRLAGHLLGTPAVSKVRWLATCSSAWGSS